jgi:hypothetical protein
MIVIYFLVLFLIILFLYLKVNNEYFNSVPIDTIDSVSKHECYLIIDTILNDINNKFNKKLERGNLERVEKTFENNKLNYKINVFIYNKDKYTNKKVYFDVGYNNKYIILNSIKNGDSREVLNIERDAIPERGSIVFKPSVNMNNVNKNNESKNNFSYISLKETPYKMVNRTNDILDEESQHYDNKRDVFNYDNRIPIWDPFGVPIELEDDKVLRNTPKFIVSNFTVKNDLYHWLFDPSQDSASRPIGT